MLFRFGIGAPIAALLLAAVVLPTAGCGKSEPGKIRVAFVSNNAHEFWTYADKGCQKGAADFGVEVLFRRPPNGTPQEQQDEVKNLLLKGVKGIAVSPNDAANQVDFYNEVGDKVPLITQDSDLPPGSNRLCYLGTNNYAAGKAVGVMVKEVMPEGGRILVLVGSLDVQNAQQRRQGVLDELAGAKDAQGPRLGKYELIDTYTDDTNRGICKTKVDNFLVRFQGDPNRLCLVGLWAYNPPAALEAVKNAKLEGKVKLVGFDEDKETLDGIEQGFIHGTVVQQPYRFGYEAVRILAGLAKGDRSVLPPGGVLDIPHDVIKKENVVEFRKKIEALLQ